MDKAQKIKALEVAVSGLVAYKGSSCGYIRSGVQQVMNCGYREIEAHTNAMLRDYHKLFGARQHHYGYCDIEPWVWEGMGVEERHRVRVLRLTDYLNYVENMG